MNRFVYRGGVHQALLLKLLAAMLFFSFSRFFFYLFNDDYFGNMGAGELLRALLAGIRFDVVAVIILNAPFILMNALPLPFRHGRAWQSVANGFYYAFNILGLALNGIDTVYFRFTSKRMTADIFSYIATGDEDIISLMPNFIADFFIEFMAWFFLSVLFVLVASRLRVRRASGGAKLRFYILNTVLFLFAGAAAIIGVRGGFQLRPVTIIDAGRYAEARNVSLVLNTPFSIIKSFGHTGLKPVTYFEDPQQMESIFSPVHQGRSDSAFVRHNVVLLIMESFGTEYIASLNGIPGSPSYTPNLDSIVYGGLAFRAYANGKQSIEALPAIVAGLPSLTTRPYITSAYGSNQISSLASVLAGYGYETAFFHGGRNGTMGFESFAGIAGFEKYYGKDEYRNDADFDGNWGIYDEPYFSYFKERLDEIAQPFFMTFFSLSSHHPYSVPEKYRGRFSKGTLEIHESIMYADHALGEFFRQAQNAPWFANTLFVITADHTSLSHEKEFQTREGIYAVPVVFYMPGKIKPARINDIAQQTDIMPSVLSFLGVDKPYVAFGNDLFDSTAARYSVSHIDGTYQLLKDGWSLQFDGREITSFRPMQLYDGQVSGGQGAEQELLSFLKAYIQQYNNRLITNTMVIHRNNE